MKYTITAIGGTPATPGTPTLRDAMRETHAALEAGGHSITCLRADYDDKTVEPVVLVDNDCAPVQEAAKAASGAK